MKELGAGHDDLVDVICTPLVAIRVICMKCLFPLHLLKVDGLGAYALSVASSGYK